MLLAARDADTTSANVCCGRNNLLAAVGDSAAPSLRLPGEAGLALAGRTACASKHMLSVSQA